VVERAEEEHGVSRTVSLSEGPGVTDHGREGAEGQRLVDVLRHGVDERDPVASVGQPGGVDAGATPDVEDVERVVRKGPSQNRLGPHPLDPVPIETVAFDVRAVVGLGLGG